MLDHEERKREVELPAVQGHPLLDGRTVAPAVRLSVLPVETDERDSLDVLAPDVRIRLVEAFLPGPGVKAFASEGVPPLPLFVAALHVRVPPPRLHVVVPVDEQPLDVPPVRGRVVRKHVEPDARAEFEFVPASAVRNVARDDHPVHALVAEPLQRLAEPSRPLRLVEVDVADHADPRDRRLRPRRGGASRKRRRIHAKDRARRQHRATGRARSNIRHLFSRSGPTGSPA